MEGDVLAGALGLPSLAAFAGAVLAGVFGLLRWFAVRLLADIDQRLRRIDEIERRVDQLLADLPLHYQRREDTIRELAQADERYQRAVEQIIRTLREELAESKKRLGELEREREADIRRYQTRDDAIREYTSLNAKIDRIYEVMMELRRER
jgi:DNA anti-recombination protein RmuC